MKPDMEQIREVLAAEGQRCIGCGRDALPLGALQIGLVLRDWVRPVRVTVPMCSDCSDTALDVEASQVRARYWQPNCREALA